MGKVTWTKERLDYLRKHYPSCADTRELAERMGMTYSSIKSKAKVLGLKRFRRTVRSTATPAEDKYIRQSYLITPVNQMAKALNRSETFINSRLKALGIVIPREVVERFIQQSRIKPGTVPPNKGKRMGDAVKAKIAHTFFTKGHKPHNTKADLYVSARYHRRDKRWYLYIRESVGRWELLHRHMYRKFVGEIPKNYVVAFKDGDSLNCITSNLELLSMKENMQRNSVQRYPEEVKDIIRTKGVLTRLINKRSKI